MVTDCYALLYNFKIIYAIKKCLIKKTKKLNVLRSSKTKFWFKPI